MNIDDWVKGVESFLAEHVHESWRQDFINSALDAGLPTRKTEEWRYTRIKPLFDKGLALSTNMGKVKDGFTSLEGFKIVTRNGQLVSADELPTGISVSDISESGAPDSALKTDPITALAVGTYATGLLIIIEENINLKKPLVLIEQTNLQAGQTASVRHRFEICSGAKAQVIEHHSSTEGSFGLINRITEMDVAESANFDHHQIQDLSELNAVHSIRTQQAGRSVFSTTVYTFSGALVRNNLDIAINGEYAVTNLNGLHLTQGSEHVDNHTRVDHKVPNCNSNEIYRGVLGGKSTGVFNGKVYVHQDAQITNAYQSNRNILISDSAVMNSKPELEIYADDVKSSHGCTIGQMDKEALFYLRSRGLSTEASINLLLHAFAGEVLEAISSEGLRAWIEERIAHKMKTINV